CRRMKARLAAQDRIIDSLADYATARVTEDLAQAIHHTRLQAAGDNAQPPSRDPAPQPWEHLPQEQKEPMRAQARRIGERLAAIGCLMVPTFDPARTFAFTDDEVHQLARLEHELSMTEPTAHTTALASIQRPGPEQRMRPGPPGQPAPGQVPAVVPWEQLSDQARAQNMERVRRIPAMLESVGFQVLRHGRGESVGEADFTSDEWATLQQAMMAAGVLVSLAERVADAEQIFPLIKALREASIPHPHRFIRELTAASTFTTGLRAGTEYADYESPALQAIRSATSIIARTVPAELAD